MSPGCPQARASRAGRIDAVARPVVPLLAGVPRQARVRTVLSRAAVLDVDGQIVVLTAPEAVWVPNGVTVVADDACPGGRRSFLGLRVGDAAWIGGQRITGAGSGLCLAGAAAEVWEPSLDRCLGRVSRAAVASGLGVLAGLCGCGTQGDTARGGARPCGASLLDSAELRLFAERLTHGLVALVTGLARRDPLAARDGVRALAGLGPGLTPAGDDVVLGACAALTLVASACEERGERSALLDLRRSLAEVAAEQTTALSAGWLRHAGRGECARPLILLAEAVAAADAPAIARAAVTVRRLGATSGRCVLAGFCAAGRALLAGILG